MGRESLSKKLEVAADQSTVSLPRVTGRDILGIREQRREITAAKFNPPAKVVDILDNEFLVIS